VIDIALEALHVLSLENRQSVAIDGLAIAFYMNSSRQPYFNDPPMLLFLHFVINFNYLMHFSAKIFGECLLISYLCRKIEQYAEERI
jgi:hypothetical protein